MSKLVAIVLSAALATGCVGCGASEAPKKQGEGDWQLINNRAALEHVDEKLDGMKTATEKLNYLALNACAADIAQIGVFGSVQQNPLMQRSHELGDRYTKIFFGSPGEIEPGTPENLSEAEYALCPGDQPVG